MLIVLIVASPAMAKPPGKTQADFAQKQAADSALSMLDYKDAATTILDNQTKRQGAAFATFLQVKANMSPGDLGACEAAFEKLSQQFSLASGYLGLAETLSQSTHIDTATTAYLASDWGTAVSEYQAASADYDNAATNYNNAAGSVNIDYFQLIETILLGY